MIMEPSSFPSLSSFLILPSFLVLPFPPSNSWPKIRHIFLCKKANSQPGRLASFAVAWNGSSQSASKPAHCFSTAAAAAPTNMETCWLNEISSFLLWAVYSAVIVQRSREGKKMKSAHTHYLDLKRVSEEQKKKKTRNVFIFSREIQVHREGEKEEDEIP